MRRCPRCRYDLEGLPDAHRCPECGFEYDPSLLTIDAWGWRGRPRWSQGVVIAAAMVALGYFLVVSLWNRSTADAAFFGVALLVNAFGAQKWISRMHASRRGSTECTLIVTDRGVEVNESATSRRSYAWDANRPPRLVVDARGLFMDLRRRTFISWIIGTSPQKLMVVRDRPQAEILRDQVEERYTRATGGKALRTGTADRPPERRPRGGQDRPLPPGGFDQWG